MVHWSTTGSAIGAELPPAQRLESHVPPPAQCRIAAGGFLQLEEPGLRRQVEEPVVRCNCSDISMYDIPKPWSGLDTHQQAFKSYASFRADIDQRHPTGDQAAAGKVTSLVPSQHARCSGCCSSGSLVCVWAWDRMESLVILSWLQIVSEPNSKSNPIIARKLNLPNPKKTFCKQSDLWETKDRQKRIPLDSEYMPSLCSKTL